MDALWLSTSLVTLAEMGDKTQLLAFLLAARFKKPAWIILGILLATVFNHGLAGVLGLWLADFFDSELLRWILAASFVAMAIWMLIPDKIEADKQHFLDRFGVFGATFITFFLAEMGDKTQIATVGLAMHYQDALWVIVGTTLGMLFADVPAVFVGHQFAQRLPMRAIHLAAALIFLVLAAWVVWDIYF